jgi:hypothetical protein
MPPRVASLPWCRCLHEPGGAHRMNTCRWLVDITTKLRRTGPDWVEPSRRYSAMEYSGPILRNDLHVNQPFTVYDANAVVCDAAILVIGIQYGGAVQWVTAADWLSVITSIQKSLQNIRNACLPKMSVWAETNTGSCTDPRGLRNRHDFNALYQKM